MKRLWQHLSNENDETQGTESNSRSQVYVTLCPYTTGSWETHDVSLREGSVEQADARELPCQSRQSTNGVVVEYAQHDPQCPWSFTSVVAPNTLQSMDDGVAAKSESVTVSLSERACNI